MNFDTFKQKLLGVFDFFKPEVQAQTRVNLTLEQASLSLDKKELALLVIDVQREFADPAEGRGNNETKRVTKKLTSLIPAFRAAGLPAYVVYFSRIKKPLQDIDFYMFKPHEKDKLIAKDADSAFRGSDIGKVLKTDKRKTLLTCGFNLNACVYSTVMDARKNGYDVIVLSDLTGNDNNNAPEDTEDRIAHMKKNGVHFARSLDVLEQISGFQKDKPLPPRNPRLPPPPAR